MTKHSSLIISSIFLFTILTTYSAAQEKTIVIKKSEPTGVVNDQKSTESGTSKVAKETTIVVKAESPAKQITIDKQDGKPAIVKMMIIQDGKETVIETDDVEDLPGIVKNIEIRKVIDGDSMFFTIDSLVTDFISEPNVAVMQNSSVKTVCGYRETDRYQKDTDLANKAVLGILIEDTDEGVVVTEVNDGSAAAKGGIRRGDVVLQINKKYIFTSNGLLKALHPYNPGDKVSVTCLRDGKKVKARVTMQGNK